MNRWARRRGRGRSEGDGEDTKRHEGKMEDEVSDVHVESTIYYIHTILYIQVWVWLDDCELRVHVLLTR